MHIVLETTSTSTQGSMRFMTVVSLEMSDEPIFIMSCIQTLETHQEIHLDFVVMMFSRRNNNPRKM